MLVARLIFLLPSPKRRKLLRITSLLLATLAVISLSGCATVTLTPTPQNGATNVPSSATQPAAITINTNTEIVNSNGNGLAPNVPVTLYTGSVACGSPGGTALLLACNTSTIGSSTGEACSFTPAPALTNGAYTVCTNGTLDVAFPSFSSAPSGNPPTTSCTAPSLSFFQSVSQCLLLSTNSTFDVGCAPGAIQVAQPPSPLSMKTGLPYTLTVTTGGCPPYVWTARVQLPAGITLSSSGLISGTYTGPCMQGQNQIAAGVNVTDPLGDKGGASFAFQCN
jgi:hypothetical protein